LRIVALAKAAVGQQRLSEFGRTLEKWITKVDVSWNEVYNTEDQVRFFKLDGNLLSVRSPEQSNVWPGRKTVFSLTFVRER
jgi:hypothetical protein